MEMDVLLVSLYMLRSNYSAQAFQAQRCGCGLVIDFSHLVQRDKQWIINIQLNQLKCDNPYVDDYYFTMYQVYNSLLHVTTIHN